MSNSNQPNDDKLDMQSPDLVQQNFEKLAELFPNCVTESATGKAIDFDLLKQELNHAVVEGNKERYRRESPGKREAIVTANLPTTKTLRPVREDSVDFDNTENIYIEGDNLEVLKLLQESYLGKIKMIYIDPPYNTGNDFVYIDDFSMSAKESNLQSGLIDLKGNKLAGLVGNPATDARYHSDWLSMLFTRLKLARNLLASNGVIFISIDDNEQANLKKICDEIFGESNFVAQFNWETKRAARGVPPKTLLMSTHEYVLCYAKELDNIKFRGLERDTEDFGNPDNDPRGLWRSESMKATGSQNNYFSIVNPENGMEFYANWAFSIKTVEQMVSQQLVLFPKDPNGTPRQKKFFDSYTNDTKAAITALGWYSTENTTKELMDIFEGAKVFDFSKPLDLIEFFITQAADQGVVLDFFSGSATTAHAVMRVNASRKGKVKYILIQIPEECDKTREAYQLGYKNICEIGKERIRRAAKKIKEETNTEIDYGFRVYRLDESNMQDVYYRPQDLDQNKMDLFGDNVKSDRTEDDLLAQVMLDWGLPLSLKIEQVSVAGKKVFKVADNSLFACFDNGIDEAFAKEIAKEKPLRIVFKDAGFKDDTAKTNVKQLLKQLSPETEMKVL